jgi:glycosyltransferase involved in cell wall biosynthesis
MSKSWGGMEMFTVTSCDSLQKYHYDVTLACIERSPIDAESDKLNLTKIRFKNPSYLSIRKIIKLARFISDNRIDLIHVHFSKDLWTVVSALILLRLKIPLVFTKHLGSFILKRDFMHRWIYRRVNCAIAISEVIRKNLIQTTPLKEEQIILLHNGVDLSRFNPKLYNRTKARKELNLLDTDFVFGMISRISPGKGHEDVIRATVKVIQKNKNVKIVFVGASEVKEKYYEEKLHSLIKHTNLNDKIIFTGFRKDIPELLSGFDAFLFPSRAEAFGIALIEAMAMGKPNIVCLTDGVIDIVHENETSLAFNRGDIDRLSEHMLSLIGDSELRDKLSVNSLSRAQDFSMENYRKKINEIYFNCAKNLYS